MMHLLKTSDLSAADLAYLLRRSAKFKAKPFGRRSVLAGETVCCYFAKPSTRTRISFETAVAHLGGTPLFMGAKDLQLGRGETLEDTARVMSRYSRALVIRTFEDADVERLASAATIPVINALTDGHHPCQSLADLLTIQQHRGRVAGQKIAYLGVIFVLLPGAVIMGFGMSPWWNSLLAGWVDLVGGRQSARALHFIIAWLLVLFVLIHVFQVVVTGLWNNVRSMITGRYRLPAERSP